MITIIKNISEILTLETAIKKDGRNLLPSDLDVKKNFALIYDDHNITWIGDKAKIPKEIIPNREIDLGSRVLTPEIVDSHTHLVFGGDRSKEYVDRLNGKAYQDIANEGGGINFTAKATAKLSQDDLFKLGIQRIDRMSSYGTGTIEIKSGYGLDFENEKKLTLVIDKLKKHYQHRIQIFNTFCAAHAIPIGKTSQEYLNEVVWPLLNEFSKSKTIDAVDIFFEKNYFGQIETEELLTRAKKFSLYGKIHADEFNDNKGAVLAAKYKALSCDHLLETKEDGFLALANSKTVATLLPGTSLFLGKKFANGTEMLKAGVKVAIATDFNPGSCHFDNLVLLASIAAPQYKMNMAQLWSAITLNASHALGYMNQGALVTGMAPRFSIFDTDHFEDITYSWGKNLAQPLSKFI